MHLVLSFDEQDLLFPKPFPANLELYWIILDSGPTGISRKKRFSSWEALPVTFWIFLEVSKTHPVSKGRLCMVLYRELLSCASLMLTSTGHNYWMCRSLFGSSADSWPFEYIWIIYTLIRIQYMIFMIFKRSSADPIPGWGQHILHTGMMTMSDAIRSMCWALLAAFSHDLEGLSTLCFFSCAQTVTSLAPWGMATSIFISLLAFSNVKYALQHALSVADDGADNAGGLILSELCRHDIMSSFLQQIQTFIESNNQWTKDSCASWAIPCASVEICDFCGSDWILLQYYIIPVEFFVTKSEASGPGQNGFWLPFCAKFWRWVLPSCKWTPPWTRNLALKVRVWYPPVPTILSESGGLINNHYKLDGFKA